MVQGGLFDLIRVNGVKVPIKETQQTVGHFDRETLQISLSYNFDQHAAEDVGRDGRTLL
jgi:hypothetical protein